MEISPGVHILKIAVPPAPEAVTWLPKDAVAPMRLFKIRTCIAVESRILGRLIELADIDDWQVRL